MIRANARSFLTVLLARQNRMARGIIAVSAIIIDQIESVADWSVHANAVASGAEVYAQVCEVGKNELCRARDITRRRG